METTETRLRSLPAPERRALSKLLQRVRRPEPFTRDAVAGWIAGDVRWADVEGIPDALIRTWSQTGETLARGGSYASAAQVFGYLAAIDPAEPGHHLGLGWVLLEQGEPARARRSFARAAARHGADLGAVAGQVLCLLALGEHDAALDLVPRALEADPNGTSGLTRRMALEVRAILAEG